MVTTQEILPQAVPDGVWRLDDIVQYPTKKKFASVIGLDDVPISLKQGSWRDIVSCDIPDISTYGWGVVGLCIQVTLGSCVPSNPVPGAALTLGFLIDGTGIGRISFPVTAEGAQVQRLLWARVTKPKELSLPLMITVRGVPAGGAEVIRILGKAALHVMVFPG